MADLKLKILMEAVDRVTAPIRAIRAGAGSLRMDVGKTANKLRELEATSSRLDKFRALKTDNQRLGHELKAAQDKVRSIALAMRDAGGASKAMQREFEAAKAAAARLKEAKSRNQQETHRLGQELKKAGVDTKNWAAAQAALKREIAATTQQATRQAAAVKALSAAKVQHNLAQERAAALTGAGTAGLTTGAIGAGLLAATAKVGIDFDAMMSKVGALAKVDRTSDAFKALERQAFDLGATTSFSASEAAEAMSNLAMAGFDAQKILAVMPNMLNLAKAGSTDLGQTAAITSNIMSGFGLEASQMGDVGDILVATFTNANTNLSLLGDTMKYVAPIAKAAGYSLGDVATLAGLLGNVGIQGSDAGTAMRAALIRLAAPPTEARKAIEELGVSTEDVAGNMRPIASILADIAEASDDLGNAGQIESFSRIFGVEAAAAMTELVAKAGSKGITEFAATINKAQGLSAKISTQMADNSKGDLDNLSSALEGVAITLTKINDAPLRRVTQWAAAAVTSVQEWMVANPQLVATLTQLGAVIATILVVGGGLAIVAAGIIGPFAILRLALTGVGVRVGLLTSIIRAAVPALAALNATAAGGGTLALGSLGQSFDSLRSRLTAFPSTVGPVLASTKATAVAWWALATKLASARAALVAGATWRGLAAAGWQAIIGGLRGAMIAARGFSLALMANPIGIVVAAITTAAVLVWKYWQPISGFFRGLFAGIAEAAGPLAPAFAGIAQAIGWIAGPIKAVAGWLSELLTPVEDIDGAGEAMGLRFGRALAGLVTTIAAAFAGLGRVIGVIWGAVSWIPAAFTAVWSSIPGFFGGLWNQVQASFTAVWAGIRTALSFSPLGLIVGAWSPLAGFFDGLWGGILDRLSSAWSAIEEKIGSVRSALGWVSGAWSTLTGAGEEGRTPGQIPAPVAIMPKPPVPAATARVRRAAGYENGADSAGTGWQRAVATVTMIAAVVAGIGRVLGTISAMVSAVPAAFTAAWSSIPGFFGGLWNQVQASFTAVWSGIRTALSFSPLGLIVEAWSPLAGFFDGLWGGILDRLTSAWSAIEEKIGSVRSALGWVSGAWSTLTGAGEEGRTPGQMPTPVATMPTMLKPPAPAATMPTMPKLQAAANTNRPAITTVAVPAAAVTVVPVPAAPPAPANANRPPAIEQTITITVHAAPGMDAEAVAREVRRQLELAASRSRSAGRSALHDG